MPIKIGNGFMSLEDDGRGRRYRRQRTGGWWEVSYWPRFFDRNQAITALAVTELLASARSGPDRRSPSPTVTSKHQPGWLPVWLPKIEKGSRTKIRNPF